MGVALWHHQATGEPGQLVVLAGWSEVWGDKPHVATYGVGSPQQASHCVHQPHFGLLGHLSARGAVEDCVYTLVPVGAWIKNANVAARAECLVRHGPICVTSSAAQMLGGDGMEPRAANSLSGLGASSGEDKNIRTVCALCESRQGGPGMDALKCNLPPIYRVP